MKIKWSEDTAQGTDASPVWAIRGVVGDVVVQSRQSVGIRHQRRLEMMRLEVLDVIRAGLGLPQEAIQEGDIVSAPAAMSALRRMAKEAELLAMEGPDQALVGLCLEFSTNRRDGSGTQAEEPDTIEAVTREWEEAGGGVVRCGDFVKFISEEECVAAWDTDAHDGAPLRYPGPAWAHGTLNDLRAALGLEVKP